MKTRRIHTKIWQDSWFSSLSHSASFLFIYLITNEHMGLSGYAEIPDRTICFETRFTQKELDKAKQELLLKVSFYKDWVFVNNLQKYDPIKGEGNKLFIALEKEISEIPQEIKQFFDGASKGHLSPIDGVNGIGKVMVMDNKEDKSVREGTKQFHTLESITEDVCKEISEQYGVSFGDVTEELESLKLYCASKGKKYANYKATLQGWIRRKIEEHKIVQQRSKKVSIADMVQRTEEA